MTQNISSWMRPQTISHRFLCPPPSFCCSPCTNLHLGTMLDGVSTSDDGWLRGIFSHLSHNFFKTERGCAPFLWHRVPHSEWWGLINADDLVLYPWNIPLRQLHAGAVLRLPSCQGSDLCNHRKMRTPYCHWDFRKGGAAKVEGEGHKSTIRAKKGTKEVRKGVGREL